MSNRKISQGKFSKQQQKSGNIHINVKHKDIVGRGMIVDVDFGKSQQEREECLGNASLIIDTFETYNKYGKLPSELLEENRELVEALEALYSQFKHVPINEVVAAKALLKKIENNQV